MIVGKHSHARVRMYQSTRDHESKRECECECECECKCASKPLTASQKKLLKISAPVLGLEMIKLPSESIILLLQLPCFLLQLAYKHLPGILSPVGDLKPAVVGCRTNGLSD